MVSHTFPKNTKYNLYSSEISLAYDKVPYTLPNTTLWNNGLRAFEMARVITGRDHIVDNKPTLVGSGIFVLIFCSVVAPNILPVTVLIRKKFLMGHTLQVGYKLHPFLPPRKVNQRARE